MKFTVAFLLAQTLIVGFAINWGNRIVDSRVQSRELNSKIPIELMGDPIRF